MQRALRDELLAEAWQQCRGLVAKLLLQVGAYLQTACDADQAGSFFCGPCGLRFHTRQQWSVHAFRSHGVVRASRCLTDATHCPACLKQYASNIAVCSHLACSQRCRLYLVRQGFSRNPNPGVGSKAPNSGCDFLLTVRQGFGPFLHSDLSDRGDDAVVERSAFSAAILQELEVLLADVDACSSFNSLLEAYRRAFCAACVDHHQRELTALIWQERLAECDALPVRAAALHNAVTTWVRRSWSADWLCGFGSTSNSTFTALFRQNSAALAALESEDGPDRVAPDFRACGGFLLCPQSLVSTFSGESSWACCALVEDCLDCNDWIGRAHRAASADDGGHFLFCFPGGRASTYEEAVRSEGKFQEIRRLHML